MIDVSLGCNSLHAAKHFLLFSSVPLGYRNFWFCVPIMQDNKKPLSTVRSFSDPCAGDLITPVNSNIVVRTIINWLPIYRQGLTPRSRGVQLGAAFGYILYGPFTILGPMRNSDYGSTIGLLSTVGAIHILCALFFLYGQAGGKFYSPPPNPTVIEPPPDLFNRTSWSSFLTGIWLGGCVGAFVAWFVYSNPLLHKLYQISFGI